MVVRLCLDPLNRLPSTTNGVISVIQNRPFIDSPPFNILPSMQTLTTAQVSCPTCRVTTFSCSQLSIYFHYEALFYSPKVAEFCHTLINDNGSFWWDTQLVWQPNLALMSVNPTCNQSQTELVLFQSNVTCVVLCLCGVSGSVMDIIVMFQLPVNKKP